MGQQEYNKKYRLAHPEYFQEYSKKYREENPEYFQQYLKKYYQENKEKCLQLTKAWQRQHRDRQRAYNKKHKQIARQFVYEYKQTHPCEICGEADPRCLDFHHNNGDKELAISRMAGRGYSPKKILAEIAKCQVLCANCHRKQESTGA